MKRVLYVGLAACVVLLLVSAVTFVWVMGELRNVVPPEANPQAEGQTIPDAEPFELTPGGHDVLTSGCLPEYERYIMHATDASLCAPIAWGTPIAKETIVSDRAREGTAYSLQFSREPDLLISFETTDFELTGDRDAGTSIPYRGFDCLVESENDDELTKCFEARDVQVDSVRKMDLEPSGQTAYQAVLDILQLDGEYKEFSFIFVPDLFADGVMHLRVSSPDTFLPDALTFVSSIEKSE